MKENNCQINGYSKFKKFESQQIRLIKCWFDICRQSDVQDQSFYFSILQLV